MGSPDPLPRKKYQGNVLLGQRKVCMSWGAQLATGPVLKAKADLGHDPRPGLWRPRQRPIKAITVDAQPSEAATAANLKGGLGAEPPRKKLIFVSGLPDVDRVITRHQIR